MKEKIEITKERFKELRNAEEIYTALCSLGVDNWEGWELIWQPEYLGYSLNARLERIHKG